MNPWILVGIIILLAIIKMIIPMGIIDIIILAPAGILGMHMIEWTVIKLGIARKPTHRL